MVNVNLECWHRGRRTINLEIENVSPTIKIIDLLNIYFNQIINPHTNSAFTWDFCHPKMELCGRGDIIYHKQKTLAECGGENTFTVLCGFTY